MNAPMLSTAEAVDGLRRLAGHPKPRRQMARPAIHDHSDLILRRGCVRCEWLAARIGATVER